MHSYVTPSPERPWTFKAWSSQWHTPCGTPRRDTILKHFH